MKRRFGLQGYVRVEVQVRKEDHFSSWLNPPTPEKKENSPAFPTPFLPGGEFLLRYAKIAAFIPTTQRHSNKTMESIPSKCQSDAAENGGQVEGCRAQR